MTKLIESRTVQILPGGTTLTTLHLSLEGRLALSTGGAQIPAPGINKNDLIVADLPIARLQRNSGSVRLALKAPRAGLHNHGSRAPPARSTSPCNHCLGLDPAQRIACLQPSSACFS